MSASALSVYLHGTPNLLIHGFNVKLQVEQFLEELYPDARTRSEFTLVANCAFGKGIQFVRDDLVFFAKRACATKAIVLWNADKLTVDAQSALRRCIEVYSHSTRFFLIVTDKYKLLKPILSRVCEVYLPCLQRPFLKQPVDQGLLELINGKTSPADIVAKGFSGLDIMELVAADQIVCKKKTEWLMSFHQIRHDIRNESILVWMMVHSLRDDPHIPNLVSFAK